MNPTSQYLRVLSVVSRSLNGNNRVSDETLVSMYTHKQFAELGVDSMDRLELIMHIEDEFNVQIPDGKTDEMNSADDIYQYLVEAAAIDPNADSEGKRIAIRQCAFQAWQEVADIPVNMICSKSRSMNKRISLRKLSLRRLKLAKGSFPF